MNVLRSTLLSLLFLSACQTFIATKSDEQSPLLKVGDKTVSSDAFIYAFEKSNKISDKPVTKEAVDEYLSSYIDFQRKVIAGEAAGIDTTQAFTKEYNQYIDQLAKPYLLSNQLNDSLVLAAYNRSKEEVSASHILIKVAQNASPEDTLKAYQKVMKIKAEFEAGASFDTLAKKYSEDPSAQRNNGYLGYFSTFQMVYPFEVAAYATPVGEVSAPVRTQFGYHLIYPKARRAARGQVKVAHIMIRTPQNSPEQVSAAENKIQVIYSMVKDGENWEALTRQFSDDPGSKNRGGELPWFGAGRMVPEFEKAAFSLKNKGEVCAPIKTTYGWHLVKLLDRKGVPPFEKMKEGIERKLRRAVADDQRKQMVVAKLAEKYQVKKVSDYDSLFKADSSAALVSVQGLPVYSSSLRQLLAAGNTAEHYQKWLQDTVFVMEKAHLSEEHPEYGFLSQEYHDGMVLFEIMEKKVWGKASKDSLGLVNYYQENKSKYKTAEQFDVVAFGAKDKALLSAVNTAMEGGMSVADISSDPAYKQIVTKNGQFSKQEFEVLNHLSNIVVGQVDSVTVDGWEWSVKINGVKAAEALPLEECRLKVMNDYQAKLEADWLSQLSKQYKVKVNKRELQKIYQQVL
ncbi:peptidylprolyl isomerase [Persicobacter psychrovividus]|uniref:Peptidyl-prolyl cis-trans isomerase n=1 Tax=Persicobacter psychrovividus TaxID=387638 RepID=A0ABN6L9Y3_9BACT|nr:peptidyl-prolyl cis-trans isomerase [Persicobacter psychrovividus]